MTCTKRELLSLIGQLQHAYCVVRPGRYFFYFLRRMINLAKGMKELHHRVRLNQGFRQWWSCFLPQWNGIAMMTSGRLEHCSFTLTQMYQGHGGVVLSRLNGNASKWNSPWSTVHITIKELVRIVLRATFCRKE